MAEGYIEVSEGTGKKLHTITRSVSGNTVHDEVVQAGIPYLDGYVARAGNISAATVDSHLLTVMGGSTRKVYITAIDIEQRGAAGAAAVSAIEVVRLTTAGTGSSVAPQPHDSSTAASGATFQSLTSPKGTEGSAVLTRIMPFAAAGNINNTYSMHWRAAPGTKGIVIPASTAAGIAIKNRSGVASATVDINIEFYESAD